MPRWNEPAPTPAPDPHVVHNVEVAKKFAVVLSHYLLPRGESLLGSMGELQLENGAIIVGPHSFAGFVDDAHKEVTSFAPADRSHVAFFDQAYRELADKHGYTFKNTPEKTLLSGQSLGVYELLTDKRVVSQLAAIFAGTSNPAAGRVRKSFADVAAPTSTDQRVEAPLDWAAARTRIAPQELSGLYQSL